MRKLLPFIVIIGCFSCKKYLDRSVTSALVVPTKINELQALLDNSSVMNFGQPILGETSCDDYYLQDAIWQSGTEYLKNAYIWNADIYQSNRQAPIQDWTYPYRMVFYSNVALEGVGKIIPDPVNQVGWNNVKGSALFLRAYAFYQLAQLYAPAFDSADASNPGGIPLRLNAGIDEPSVRSSVHETYSRILSDLLAAYPLLPIQQSTVYRPSRAAAFALLAKTYLLTGSYSLALRYADSSLKLKSTLLNYNTLTIPATTAQSFPLPPLNPELLFHGEMESNTFVSSNSSRKADTLLYELYSSNDIRKKAFYLDQSTSSIKSIRWKGNYTGSSLFFTGLSTNEIYLIKAESQARAGDVAGSLSTLNILLANRIQTSSFVPVSGLNNSDALQYILTERRKELACRGIRWSDLKRLNKDSQYAVTIHRKLALQSYSLPPNDKRYVLPLPLQVIDLTGMPQNNRD